MIAHIFVNILINRNVAAKRAKFGARKQPSFQSIYYRLSRKRSHDVDWGGRTNGKCFLKYQTSSNTLPFQITALFVFSIKSPRYNYMIKWKGENGADGNNEMAKTRKIG